MGFTTVIRPVALAVLISFAFSELADAQTYFFDKNENGYIDDEEIGILYNYWAMRRPLPQIECPQLATDTPTPIPTNTPTHTPTATDTPVPTKTTQPTVTPEEGLEELEVEIPNMPQGVKPLVLKRIPAGTFVMGSPSNESGRYSDEGPQHQVTITKDFYLGKYEVTQAQWRAVMGSNPARSYGVGNDYPVYYVSWNDCQTFITRLNGMGLGTFRLPTEAEWEYACRAGTTTRFYWGDSEAEDIMKQYCWYFRNANDGYWTNPHADEEGTQPVGLKIPNDFGLYDMSGNVWEWCTDYYDSGYYSRTPESDPVNQSNQFGSDRVVRGGCWHGYPGTVRSACRYGDIPGVPWHDIGFRVVVGGVASRTN